MEVWVYGVGRGMVVWVHGGVGGGEGRGTIVWLRTSTTSSFFGSRVRLGANLAWTLPRCERTWD